MTIFLTIFRRFSKILYKLSEGQRVASEHFSKIFEDNRRFSKITENLRGRTDDVAIIRGHIAMVISVFTSENDMLFSRVGYRVYVR